MPCPADYAAYGHLMHVKKLIGDRYRHALFCLDHDSVLAPALAALMVNEVIRGRVDIAQIKFEKGLSNDKKQAYKAIGDRAYRDLRETYFHDIQRMRAEHPALTEQEALVAILLEQSEEMTSPEERARALKNDGFKWPFHNKGEPNKTIYLWTGSAQHTAVTLARLLCRGSTHPADAYFARLRRRVAGFERGSSSTSNAGRTWYAYAFYDPEMVVKMLNILRFYQNYMLKGPDNQTPAMRIGLAKGVVRADDLFSYT